MYIVGRVCYRVLKQSQLLRLLNILVLSTARAADRVQEVGEVVVAAEELSIRVVDGVSRVGEGDVNHLV